MAQTRDLYEVLGVARDATPEEIKKAFRRLAREFHPDVNADPEAEHRFKEINLAYETLSDPDKRRRYDMFGGEGLTPDMFSFMGDVTDIFEAFFGSPFGGQRRRSRGPARGSDIRLIMGLSFEEAAFGVSRSVPVERTSRCSRCEGSGAEPGTAPSTCRTCSGRGEVSDLRRSVFGAVMTTQPCATCGGEGQVIASPCDLCRGAGRMPENVEVPIDIPAGVDHGVELRVEGEGHAGARGGPPGDLYLALRVDPHPVFERQGEDLACTLDLPLTQAVLGADVRVETLDDAVTLTVPPGTASGTVLRVKGAGVPRLHRRGRGDLYVRVEVEMPSSLAKDQRGLVERLAELRGERPDRDPVPGRLRPRT